MCMYVRGIGTKVLNCFEKNCMKMRIGWYGLVEFLMRLFMKISDVQDKPKTHPLNKW